MPSAQQTFDYVIIGAGSAGCTLANRLSADPSVTVCLIEAGGKDTSAFIHAPAGFAFTVSQGFMSWPYETVPQTALGSRKGFQPRGKVMGGSSSVNGMIYMRGSHWDYDHWASLGNTGWSYKEVLPYFRRSEHNETLNNEYHGQDGPLNVAALPDPSPLSEVFLQACEHNGLPRNPDPNGESQYGCWMSPVTQKDGERCSAAKAFITPVLNRPNLTVLTNTHAEKLLLDTDEKGNKVAYGVSVFPDNQKTNTAQMIAKREVILSAGAYGSPQLMMLSGIGDRDELSEQSIDCIHHLPGVGKNLQDHITVVPIYRTDSYRETFGTTIRGVIDIFRGIFDWRNKRRGKITTKLC